MLADPCYGVYLLCYSDSTLGTYQVNANKSCDYSYIEGIEQFDNTNNQVIVYPNPAQNILQFTANNKQLKEIKIIDILGEEVYKQLKPTYFDKLSIGSNPSREGNGYDVDVSNLNNGVYFIQAKTTDGFYTKKFIVQH